MNEQCPGSGPQRCVGFGVVIHDPYADCMCCRPGCDCGCRNDCPRFLAMKAAEAKAELEQELRAQRASVNRCGDTSGRNDPVDL